MYIGLVLKGMLEMGSQSGITWRNEWVRPYESMWSIIEKVKIANSITGTDLLLFLNPGSKGRQIRNVHKLSEATYSKLKDLIGIDFSAILNAMLSLSKLELSNPLHYFHTNLCYCDKCIQYNYHSYLHQHKLVVECPFHLTKLRRCCPVCKKESYYYNVAFSTPFTCKCGMQIYQTGNYVAWSSWSSFHPMIKVDTNYGGSQPERNDLAVFKLWLKTYQH